MSLNKNKIYNLIVFWNWFNFGVMFIIYKNVNSSRYYMSLDLQVAWFNLWIQLFRK